MRINIFCFTKDTETLRRQITDPEKIFANLLSNKGLVFGMYKELSKLAIKKKNQQNSLIRKQAKDMHRHFTKENIQAANKDT